MDWRLLKNENVKRTILLLNEKKNEKYKKKKQREIEIYIFV